MAEMHDSIRDGDYYWKIVLPKNRKVWKLGLHPKDSIA